MRQNTKKTTLKRYIDTLQEIYAKHGDIPVGRLYTKPFESVDYCVEVTSLPQYIDSKVDSYYKGKPFVNIVSDNE